MTGQQQRLPADRVADAFVAPDNPAAVADGLYALWSDPEKRRTLADHAFTNVRKLYSIQRATDIQVKVYESLVRWTYESRLTTARPA